MSISSKFIDLKLFILSPSYGLNIYWICIYNLHSQFSKIVFSLVSFLLFRNFINHFKYQFWLHYLSLMYFRFVFYLFLSAFSLDFWFDGPSFIQLFFFLCCFIYVCLQFFLSLNMLQ